AAHGLEQEVIYALIGCVCGRPAEGETPAGDRYRNILARLEDLLEADPVTSLTEICARLGVSHPLPAQVLRAQLGYVSLALPSPQAPAAGAPPRDGGRDPTSISAIARRFGFGELGRFAATYRALYGELPSGTLRRTSQNRLV